jgi:hypothetical protein
VFQVIMHGAGTGGAADVLYALEPLLQVSTSSSGLFTRWCFLVLSLLLQLSYFFRLGNEAVTRHSSGECSVLSPCCRPAHCYVEVSLLSVSLVLLHCAAVCAQDKLSKAHVLEELNSRWQLAPGINLAT